MNNLRVIRRDPTTHEDFEWHRGAPSLSAYDAGDRIQEGMERDSVIAMNAAFQSRRLVALLMILMSTLS